MALLNRRKCLLDATWLKSTTTPVLFNIPFMVEDQFFYLIQFFQAVGEFVVHCFTLAKKKHTPLSANTHFNAVHDMLRHILWTLRPKSHMSSYHSIQPLETKMAISKMCYLDITTITKKHYNSNLTIPRNIAGAYEEKNKRNSGC